MIASLLHKVTVHLYMYWWSSYNDSNQENDQLSNLFYNKVYIWLANLLIDTTFAIGKLFQVGERN